MFDSNMSAIVADPAVASALMDKLSSAIANNEPDSVQQPLLAEYRTIARMELDAALGLLGIYVNKMVGLPDTDSIADVHAHYAQFTIGEVRGMSAQFVAGMEALTEIATDETFSKFPLITEMTMLVEEYLPKFREPDTKFNPTVH